MEKEEKKQFKNEGDDFFDRLLEEGWTDIKTAVDVVSEPVLILDKDFRVMSANAPFYKTFQVDRKDTEKKIVYELGNGQWDIPALRKLLEDILSQHTFFKGFEVERNFPGIGHKIMILNARQIHSRLVNGVSALDLELIPPMILLAMEDVTEIMSVAEKLAERSNQREEKLAERTLKLEISIQELKRQIGELRACS